MIPQDVLLAVIVLVLLFGTIIGLVSWARGGAPHDDGTGSGYRAYLPPSADEDETWVAPPMRLPTKLPGDEQRGRPKVRTADADDTGSVSDASR